MTTIDPNQRIAAALRQQMTALRQRSGTTNAPGAHADAASARTASEVMAQRMRAIAPSDPDRRRKAVRVLLESEIAREFGAGLLNDPAFPQMLDAVQEQMQDDTETAAAVLKLGDLLLAGKLP